jgi:hypothetical protein
MRQSRAEKIAFVVQKNLRFINQSTKSCGMHDPVAVTLESRARWCRQLRITAASGIIRMASIRSKQH